MEENYNYPLQAKTTTIKATSKISTKIHDNFYTFEYSEERSVPDSNSVNLTIERENLWNAVNDECYKQIEAIYDEIEKQEQEYKKRQKTY